MRAVPASLDNAWNSGKFVGSQRAQVRLSLGSWFMSEQSVPGNIYRSAMFNQGAFEPIEIPNIQKWSWTKSVDTPASTFSLTLLNVKAYPPGVAAQLLAADQLQTGYDQGAYTPKYGGINPVNRSVVVDGYQYVVPSRIRSALINDPWQRAMVPDSVMKSFEGYGCDPSVAPEDDPNLVQTGIWLIDQVVFGVDGSITVTGRDLGRLLVDTTSVYPNVPANWYPLAFDAYQEVPAITSQVPVSQSGIGGLKPSKSSNLVHNGDAPEYGHTLGMAFDNDRSTYWLSVGNAAPNADYSFEYVEGDLPASTVGSVTVDVKNGPYTAYVSVFADGAWQGSAMVPYNPDDPISGPNGSDIHYIAGGTAAADTATTFSFVPIDGVTKVRVCLSNLHNFHIGPFVYRAGIRQISCSYSRQTGTKTVVLSPAHMIGNYGDFTDLIKLFCAWSGFYWPRSGNAYAQSDGTVITENAPSDDPVLKVGRIWGDLQNTGTHALLINPLGADIWDHKTMADCITYIQGMIGFNFFIGDLGAVVWRLPNWYYTGNYTELDSGRNGAPLPPRVLTTVLIDEDKQLLDLQVQLSSMNVRERVAVSSLPILIGAVIAGWNPNPDGQVRIGVYNDQRFGSAQECQVMAELIALQQMFTYRTDNVVIPGYPRIQIDDQVMIKERITQEYYRHYVSAIKSDTDLSTGEWTYILTTNWLGTTPVDDWVFDFTTLTEATQQYLKALLQPPAYSAAS